MQHMVLSGKGLENSATWLKGHMSQPYVGKKLIKKTVQKLTYKDPMSAIEWLDSSYANHPNLEVTGYTTVIDTWAEEEGVNAVGEWLNNHSEHPQYDRLAFDLAKKMWKKNPDAAVKWLNSMSDEDLKAALMKKRPFK